MHFKRWTSALVLALASNAGWAQELRCTQIFMNASEKRICATPALMQLDQQIGDLGRRAALHQDNFKSDQRAFRKTLKTCDGDEICLTTVYQNRIAVLQAFVSTLPPPTDAERAKLAGEAQAAQEKRDAQADTRERIAEKLEKADAAVTPPTAEAEAASPPVTQEQVVVQQPIERETPVAAPVTTMEAPQPASQKSDGGPGWFAWTIIILAIIGSIVAFFEWLYKVVRRCPRCTKWWAGQVIDQDHESYTSYETREFKDEHRNRYGHLIKTTTKRRPVPVRVHNTTSYMRCQLCENRWIIKTSSRSR